MEDDASTDLVESFFNTVATRMAVHLRQLVNASLEDFARFFEQYLGGNDFKSTDPHSQYHVMNFSRKPVFIQRLYADGPKIAFDPPNQDIRSMLQRCIKHIVNGAAHIPRIESHLFDSKTKLLVRHVRLDEEIVDHSTQRVLNVFSKNLPGPQLYLHEYDQYQSLLNNKSETETIEFLKHSHPLDEFEAEIKQKTALTNEIILKRISAPLNLINLDCRDLNDHLIKNVQKLREKLVQYCIEENSRLNKDIVREYDEIATTVSVPADEVEELVRTTDYLAKALETTVYKLAYKIGEAKERLMFLLDYALMPREFKGRGPTDCDFHRHSSGRSEAQCSSVSLAREHHEYSRFEPRTTSSTAVSFVWWMPSLRMRVASLVNEQKNVCEITSFDTRRSWKICRKMSISFDEKM